VVGDVGSSEREFSVRVPLFGFGLGKLRVLDDSERSSLPSDDSDGFGRDRLGDDLSSAFGLLSDAVSDEGWVRDSNQTVVDSVGVDVLDLSIFDDGDDGSGVGGRDGTTKG